MSKTSKLRRLKVFDQGAHLAIDYWEMLKPGRVNIIDLSDVENIELRNLVIAEMLRDILMQQQDLYDGATKDRPDGAETDPLMTNVISGKPTNFCLHGG